MRKTIIIGAALLGLGVLVGVLLGKLSASNSRESGPGTLTGPARVEPTVSLNTLRANATLDEKPSSIEESPHSSSVASDESSLSESVALTDSESEQLRELARNAEALADTYNESGFVPPEIPADIEEKLRAISPELLALVRIASRIPPREVRQKKQ